MTCSSGHGLNWSGCSGHYWSSPPALRFTFSVRNHRTAQSWPGYRRSNMPRPDIRLTPDEQAAFLRNNRKCALATIDPQGFPHIVAMNYRERDGVYYMSSYGKAQKVVNIRRDPKVGIMVESGGAYAELKGVMVRGECEIVEDPDTVAEIMGWLGEGRTAERPSGASRSAPKRVVLKITPHKTFTWDHSKLGGRY